MKAALGLDQYAASTRIIHIPQLNILKWKKTTHLAKTRSSADISSLASLIPAFAAVYVMRSADGGVVKGGIPYMVQHWRARKDFKLCSGRVTNSGCT